MGVSKGLVCLWSPKGDSLGLSGFFNKGKGNLMGGGGEFDISNSTENHKVESR